MSLYVIPVPAPAAGVDWSYTVPGQYIEHITAISATLGTGGGTPTVAHDASGNGHDGTYQGAPTVPTFVPGLLPVPSDGATDFDATFPPFGVNPNVDMAPFTFDMSADFTIEMWVQASPLGIAHGLGALLGASPPGGVPDLRLWMGFTFQLQIDQNGGNAYAIDGTPLMDGNPHYLAVTYTAGNVQFYIDTVAQPLTLVGGLFAPTAFTAMKLAGLANVGYAYGIYDEFAIYPYVDAPAGIDAHYAAASVSFAAYTAAVLGDGPSVYYHLGGGLPGGRQVDLQVTDGTHTVDEIPTGFADVTTAGPYLYSWQPNLNSSTQTPDGTLTTVAIPNLILPAGYTLGTRTLDLQPTDQWSNINIWWNSDVMDQQQHSDPFVYPPGAYLVIVPQGV